jgi:hypothetical protein
VGASFEFWGQGTSAGVMLHQLACVQSRVLTFFCIRREIAPLHLCTDFFLSILHLKELNAKDFESFRSTANDFDRGCRFSIDASPVLAHLFCWGKAGGPYVSESLKTDLARPALSFAHRPLALAQNLLHFVEDLLHSTS